MPHHTSPAQGMLPMMWRLTSMAAHWRWTLYARSCNRQVCGVRHYAEKARQMVVADRQQPPNCRN